MFLTAPLSRYMKNQVNVLISGGDSVFEITISFQLQWVSRTVMVQENNVDEAMKVLNGIMAREGMLKR